MNIDSFFKHWGLAENPFRAEEARQDGVFMRLIDKGSIHPDFGKVFGYPEQPSTSVVFGDKGSGKTALRLLIERKLREHNLANPKKRVWVVKYDDLNPILDRFTQAKHGAKKPRELSDFRLEDHLDGILSSAITQLVNLLTGEEKEAAISPRKARRAVKRMSRQRRMDLAELVILYDQPPSGHPESRWGRIRRLTRLQMLDWMNLALVAGVALMIASAVLSVIRVFDQLPDWQTTAALIISAIGGVGLCASWLLSSIRLNVLVRKMLREIHVVDRTTSQLRNMLGDLPPKLLDVQPIPVPGDHDSRYQLMRRFVSVLGELGYTGMMVLVDRIDEPTLIKGDPEKMKSVIWPMFDNKFLQQEGVGFKLLLPLELNYLLKREGTGFFQKARLDKQHMIDRLEWSGAILYDLCNRRLQACMQDGKEPIELVNLFGDDVNEQDLIEALNQMRQPRDAFKFLYRVIQEHCRNTPDHDAHWQIPKLSLEHIIREQATRLHDLSHGLAPA